MSEITAEKIKALLFADETEQLDELLVEIASNKTQSNAEVLLASFEHNEDYYDEMYELLHLIESFDKDTYINAYIDSLKKGTFDQYWYGMLLLRMMNDESYFSQLCKSARLLDTDSANNLIKICEAECLIRDDFKEQVVKLITILKNRFKAV